MKTKKNIPTMRLAALLLAVLLTASGLVSCSSGGKTLMTLKQDGIKVTLSVNLYELMMSRMKGTLCYYGYTANGVTADKPAFWAYTDKFDGEKLQTADEYYRDRILDNCRNYAVALYLFEKNGLSLTAAQTEEIESQMAELIKADGDGSKTKLNTVLSAYGVNYNILKNAYLIEAKVKALQTYLYGENASSVGNVVKDEFLNDNYVHFRQIFLASYRYAYETDANGDVIYYYTSGEKKDHICYDSNGVTATDSSGSIRKDENGDYIRYKNDGEFKTVAYDTENGEPAYIPTEDGKGYQTVNMTDDEKKALGERADALFTSLTGKTAAEFESAQSKESDDMTDQTQYTDGYYLQKNLDYSASGEDYAYLEEIIAKMADMKDGEIAMVKSPYGYHIVMKYAMSSGAYDMEANETWFENFGSDLTEQLFLELCQSYYDKIIVDEKVLASATDMKSVGINYNY